MGGLSVIAAEMHLCVTYVLRFTSHVCVRFLVENWKLVCIKHNRILKTAGRALFSLSGHLMPCVAHLMLVMLPYAFCSTHLMLVVVLNMPEQCYFHNIFFTCSLCPNMPKYMLA